MRLLINGAPALQGRTGVGNYTFELLRRLERHPDVEELGVFDGLRIRPFHRLADTLGKDRTGKSASAIRRLVRGCFPPTAVLTSMVRDAFFARAAHQTDWDLYHETNYVLRPFRGPTVTTVHDMSFLRFPSTLPRDRLSWLRSGLRRSIQQAYRVACVSEFSKNELLDCYPRTDPAKVAVTPNGVDPAFRPDLPTEEARSTYGLPKRFILSVGTLEPRKNLIGLLRALERLPASFRREHPLVVAGPQGWRNGLVGPMLARSVAAGESRVLGRVPQSLLPGLMAAATLFCYPSLYEGFGLPPLEAAACGTPAVVSRAASLPEVMGDAALYADPRSPEDMAQAIRKGIEDSALRARLRQAGLARAACFTWERCAEATWRTYREALRRGKRGR